jgi:uncharacterized protein YkwD
MPGGARKRPGAALLVLLLGLAVAAQFAAGMQANAQQFTVPQNARTLIFDATNAYRAEHGLPALRLSPNASKVAQGYAKYLAETDKVGHRADGRSARDRLMAGGMEVCQVWENWHKSWADDGSRMPVDEAMTKAMFFWKNSPGHERTLRARAKEIGIGVVGWKHGNRWMYTEVQLFFDRSCLKNRKKERAFPAIVP